MKWPFRRPPRNTSPDRQADVLRVQAEVNGIVHALQEELDRLDSRLAEKEREQREGHGADEG